MVWSIDRLGRSVLHVANALAELDAAGVALYSDQQARVFGEQERHVIRSRVNAGLAVFGRREWGRYPPRSRRPSVSI